jgi:hypothetical protein
MKRYWDSSALIVALHDSRVEKLAREPDQFTRLHTLAESFSTLTGGRLGFQYPPDDAAALLREITAGMRFVQLELSEILDALDQAQKNGIRGGRVHDYLHARAAAKANVDQLLTDNYADFAGLEDGFMIAAP